VYAQPEDEAWLAAQQAFAREHAWFQVQKLNARSHFPMFEVPDALALAIETFVAGVERERATTPEEVQRLWARAMNAGDLNAALALYERDAVLVPAPGQRVVGRASIREALAGFLALQPRFSLDVQPAVGATDTALLTSRWSMTGTAPDGSAVELAGTTADVVRKQADGTWLTAIDCPFGAS
jgi:uncharacterized protein (TIGR02246 family)